MHRSSSIGQIHDDKKEAWQPISEYGTSHGNGVDAGVQTSGVRGDRGITVNREGTNHRSTRRRYIISFMILFSITATIYIQFFHFRPQPITNMAIPTSSTQEPISSAPESSYDTQHAKPDFHANIPIKVQDLDTQYVPHHKKEGRLIIVGDVHGMKHELLRLLKKVSFHKKHDHLILVGDLITKGPDSLGVVDLAMSLGASAVRGNHEDRVLLAYDEMSAKSSKPGEIDDLEETKYNDEDRELARALSETQVAWLKGLPIILRIGNLEGMGEVVVVHAGLVAGVSLQAQDSYQCMNMRTIDMHTHVPSDARDGTSWTKLWNHEQKNLPKPDRSTVIYGHDSKRGLRIEDYSKGIDTGCRKGHKLTALVISGGKSDVHQEIVHVKCKKKKHDRSLEENGEESEDEEEADS